ncbi:MAG: hypothetical protein QMC90_05485, partial [Dehalococcoidales bacterium]|nr:hypothetical protein [Dehalococcoidales bacterium]
LKFNFSIACELRQSGALVPTIGDIYCLSCHREELCDQAISINASPLRFATPSARNDKGGEVDKQSSKALVLEED